MRTVRRERKRSRIRRTLSPADRTDTGFLVSAPGGGRWARQRGARGGARAGGGRADAGVAAREPGVDHDESGADLRAERREPAGARVNAGRWGVRGREEGREWGSDARTSLALAATFSASSTPCRDKRVRRARARKRQAPPISAGAPTPSQRPPRRETPTPCPCPPAGSTRACGSGAQMTHTRSPSRTNERSLREEIANGTPSHRAVRSAYVCGGRRRQSDETHGRAHAAAGAGHHAARRARRVGARTATPASG